MAAHYISPNFGLYCVCYHTLIALMHKVELNGGHSIAPKTTSANAASASP